MKIIAHTTEGYVVSISQKELKALLAKDDSRKANTKLEIGTELSFTLALQNIEMLENLKISDSYQVLHYLKEAKIKLDGLVTGMIELEKPIIEVQRTIAKEKV